MTVDHIAIGTDGMIHSEFASSPFFPYNQGPGMGYLPVFDDDDDIFSLEPGDTTDIVGDFPTNEVVIQNPCTMFDLGVTNCKGDFLCVTDITADRCITFPGVTSYQHTIQLPRSYKAVLMSTQDTFHITYGDTGPSLEVVLQDSDGNVFDLTGATVVFEARHATNKFLPSPGSTLLSAAAVIVNPPGTDGRVRYDWAAGDTDVTLGHGPAVGKFQVTTAGGQIINFPNGRTGNQDEFIKIRVTDDVPDPVP